MRKRLVTPIPHGRVPFDEGGLDIANLGIVEITSEDEAYPIECALYLGQRRGWRAAEPGPQIIRLLFDQPQKLKRIWLVFEETETQRTQEFALRWSPDHGRSFREPLFPSEIAERLNRELAQRCVHKPGDRGSPEAYERSSCADIRWVLDAETVDAVRGRGIAVERIYWLHIIESKSPDPTTPSTYLLARADAPRRNYEGGAMPMVHHGSWRHVAKCLADCGVDGTELEKAKTELDTKGSYTLTELKLNDQQVLDLGFTDHIGR